MMCVLQFHNTKISDTSKPLYDSTGIFIRCDGSMYSKDEKGKRNPVDDSLFFHEALQRVVLYTNGEFVDPISREHVAWREGFGPQLGNKDENEVIEEEDSATVGETLQERIQRVRRNNNVVLNNISTWSGSRIGFQNAQLCRENDEFSHELELHLQESGFFDPASV